LPSTGNENGSRSARRRVIRQGPAPPRAGRGSAHRHHVASSTAAQNDSDIARHVLSAIFNRNPDKRSALPTRFQDNVQRDGIFSRRRISSP
jgi:hypothetical protein